MSRRSAAKLSSTAANDSFISVLDNIMDTINTDRALRVHTPAACFRQSPAVYFSPVTPQSWRRVRQRVSVPAAVAFTTKLLAACRLLEEDSSEDIWRLGLPICLLADGTFRELLLICLGLLMQAEYTKQQQHHHRDRQQQQQQQTTSAASEVLTAAAGLPSSSRAAQAQQQEGKVAVPAYHLQLLGALHTAPNVALPPPWRPQCL